MKLQYILPIVAVAVTTFTAPQAQANQCLNASQDEYLLSRYVFCREYISDELRGKYEETRFDGSDRALSISKAEPFIDSLNALSRGNTANLGALLSDDPTFRAVLRGLLAEEVFADDTTTNYCAYKFPPLVTADLFMPSTLDPEFIGDIDYFFGCGG